MEAGGSSVSEKGGIHFAVQFRHKDMKEGSMFSLKRFKLALGAGRHSYFSCECHESRFNQ